ncbi:protein-serine/threonine phosphatase [Malassezia equina]|uniref:Protein-serine/threonine phosphatase n=1 Tax=Malassezia equina TaxID=1381935 RepID=A0AAF0IYF8_9BASI|nr:protein-serine/threonine phosphatase [Malassezia equina]
MDTKEGRTMEDAHVYQHDFNNVPGQGYFAIFDGHAGKFAAEWCRDNMSEILSDELKTSPDMDVREVMKNVFLKADDQLETESAKAGAIRLTYDHKGTDEHESKRITEKGGVLAVTRSLGDFSMKEFVVGAPFTTCIDLCDEDEFLIIACDGVCI